MRLFSYILSLVLLSAQQVHANDFENFDPKENISAIDLFKHTLFFPFPSWTVKGENPFDNMKTAQHQEDSEFMLEHIPANEVFEDWKTIYAIRTFDGTFEDANAAKKYWVEQFNNVCGTKGMPPYTTLKPVSTQSDFTFIRLLCPSYTGTPVGPYKKGVGEVALAAIAYRNGEAVIVYQEWLGDAFDTNRPSTWPVSEQHINDTHQYLAERLKLIEAE